MKIKLLKEETGNASLLVKATNIKFMNALRRSAMKAVPVMAIEELAIHKNNSVLSDEYIGARLGMLPVKASYKSFKKGDKAKFTLKEKGPKTVLSSDIKSLDKNAEITAKNIPITKLKEDEEIFMEIEAVANTGKEHSKWQPGVISYNEEPSIEGKIDEKNAKAVLQTCPKNILENKAGKIIIKKPEECDICENCIEAGKGKLKMKLSNSDFILRINTHGGMEIKDILKKAAETISDKCIEFEAELKKIK